MLGAVLLQESKPVMYMSRALTETDLAEQLQSRVTISLCKVYGKSQ